MPVPLLALVLTALIGSGAASAGAENDLADAVRLLGDRLDQLAATAEPPLFKRHLISVNAIVHSEAACAMLYAGPDSKAAKETLGYVDNFKGIQRGCRAVEHLPGRPARRLILARLSGRDATLQFSASTSRAIGTPKSVPAADESARRRAGRAAVLRCRLGGAPSGPPDRPATT